MFLCCSPRHSACSSILLFKAGLNARVAVETPSRGCELPNETFFRHVLRAEVIEVAQELNFVFLLGFVLENDGLGGESMGDGVERESVPALLCVGAARLCSVDACGFDFA